MARRLGVRGWQLLRCSTVLGVLLSARGAAAEWASETIGGSSVHVYTPASSGTIGTGRGLIIGLHGCTQTNTAIRDRGNWESAAERFGIVVALPQVPNGGVFAGCWDYYGANHARTGRHDGYLLSLVDSLLGESALEIDADQVYIAGLSSGAGQSVIMGCLAPDIFAGVGINAGPAPGTTSSEFSVVSSTAREAADTCRDLAGSASGDFSTQLLSVIAGTTDFIVAQGYARVNAEAFADIYAGGGAALTESVLDVTALEGFEPAGTGALFSDSMGPRISLITASGMGHAFPAGSGAGPEISFVASEGVNWPMHLAELFTTNNRRVANRPPVGTDAGVVREDAGAVSGGDGGGNSMGSRDGGTVRADSSISGGGEESDEEGCGCAATRTAGSIGWFLALSSVFASVRAALWRSRRGRAALR